MNWFALSLQGFTIHPAVDADVAALQALFESDPAYAFLVEGAKPQPDEGFHAVHEFTPGFPRENFAKLVVRDEAGRIAAFVELLRHYPEAYVLWLGLIFVAPHARGGLGLRLMEAMHVAAAKLGFGAMQLGMVAGNRVATLYERLGYREIRRALREGVDGIARTVIVLERKLEP